MASKKNKHRSIYYMFPSTRAEAKSRFYRNVIWSIIVGILAGLIVIGLMYGLNRH